MSEHYLTPEERAELDALMAEAGCPDGDALASHEIGERVRAYLEDAAQAGRPWASWKLDDATEDGCLKAWKSWYKSQHRVTVVVGDKLVSKAALMSTRRRAEDGSEYWQPSLYVEMTAEELRHCIAGSQSRIDAEQVNVEVARRLLKAVEDTESATVGEAMTALGTTIDDYLLAA